jgi:hypothetical protein
MAKNSATRMITGKVRASYFYGITPANDKDDDGNETIWYRTQIIINKSDKDTLTRMKACIEAAMLEAVAKKWNGVKPAKLALPLRDGDKETTEDGEPLDPAVYGGKWFMNIKTKDKPGVLGPDQEPPYLRDAGGNPRVDPQQGGFLYDPQAIVSGDFIRVSLNFYGYAVKGKKGISGGLNNIQLISKGTPLGNKSRAEDDFKGGFVDDEAETESADPLADLLD